MYRHPQTHSRFNPEPPPEVDYGGSHSVEKCESKEIWIKQDLYVYMYVRMCCCYSENVSSWNRFIAVKNGLLWIFYYMYMLI